MARRSSVFRQSDLTRAIKGAKAAGIEIREILINATGAIELHAGSPDDAPKSESDADQNPWDTIQ